MKQKLNKLRQSGRAFKYSLYILNSRWWCIKHMAVNNFSKQVPNYCMFYENHTKSKESTTRYVSQTY